MNVTPLPRILILGAGGLIGHALALDLMRRGFSVVGVARRFSSSQRHALGVDAVERPFGEFDAARLADLLRATKPDVVVNCLGVLQSAPGESASDIHDAFVARLISALRVAAPQALLIHLSIPGIENEDKTEFARSKRSAEQRIAESGLAFAILRPGFVLAPAAYGGSAMLRALAALPLDLPATERRRPFATIAVEDVAETVALLARDIGGPAPLQTCWDLMHPAQTTLGDAVAALSVWLGADGGVRLPLPRFALDAGAKAGDLAAFLGWRPPIRSTALAELRRGVTGDPHSWMAATKIAPRPLNEALAFHPATLQEKWFARLYLLKALIIGCLVAFWCVSGLIALTVAFRPAGALLAAHGFDETIANVATVASSLMDISVGLAIAVRRIARIGLIAGIAVSLLYMLGAAILTPDLWIEPLGALVKTGPAIVLMLVALAVIDSR